MKKLFKLFTVVALFSLGIQPVIAETTEEAQVKTLMQARMGEQVQVQSVIKTPYAGLFEVRTEDDIIYTDANAQYMITGHVIDTRTYRDYTALRLEEISHISFSELPFQFAMKQVKGNGKRVFAVFEDPNCSYCKRFRDTVTALDNVTIYTFMYNILSPDSVTKSRDIWCAANPVQAWDDWMASAKVPQAAPATCLAPNEQVLKLGKKIRVMGTPTIVFSDGSRTQGALDLATLEQKLSSIAE